MNFTLTMETSAPLYLIEEKLEQWWEYSVRMLPNFILAIVIIFAFIIVAKFVRRISAAFMLRFTRSVSVSGLVSGALYSLVIISGLMSALGVLQLDKTVSSLLAGVGIIGLALGFAFQDLTANFISGVFIAFKRPFDVGHIVETNGFLGTIEDIELRATKLRTSAGLHVIIPNKDIFQKAIINYSLTDKRRIEIDFIIPNTVDIVFAEKIIRESIMATLPPNKKSEIEFYFTAIENPNIRINVAFWTDRIEPHQYMEAKHHAIIAIYNVFKENKIYKVQIPEPQHQNISG